MRDVIILFTSKYYICIHINEYFVLHILQFHFVTCQHSQFSLLPSTFWAGATRKFIEGWKSIRAHKSHCLTQNDLPSNSIWMLALTVYKFLWAIASIYKLAEAQAKSRIILKLWKTGKNFLDFPNTSFLTICFRSILYWGSPKKVCGKVVKPVASNDLNIVGRGIQLP